VKRVTVVASIVAVFSGIAACSTAADDRSAASTPSQVLHLKTVSQYGITWTFKEAVRVGQFFNGDYYVVGPVTVTDIDPRPLIAAEVPETEVVEQERKCLAPVYFPNPISS
jgi:hypothetical protein